MNYFFKNDGLSMFDINANIHYLFPIASNISLYPLAGFTYTNWHLDLGKAGDYDVSGSDGKFGVNLGAYGAGRGIRILHYINSSGLKEIIEGTEIAHEFRKIYACSFLYDVDGIAYWPAVAVNYTNKTQFIFKINKGVESVFDSKMVNRYIPENERPVPFKHMIYVGDGTTDIPCMRLVKNSGGHSIAVYNPDQKGARKEMASLIHDNRVSHVCPADYSEGSDMDILVKTIIDKIDLDDRLEKLEVVK